MPRRGKKAVQLGDSPCSFGPAIDQWSGSEDEWTARVAHRPSGLQSVGEQGGMEPDYRHIGAMDGGRGSHRTFGGFVLNSGVVHRNPVPTEVLDGAGQEQDTKGQL